MSTHHAQFAAAAAVLMLAAGSNGAMAGNRHVSVNVGELFQRKLWQRITTDTHVVVNVGGGGGCGYYYDRWQDTGRFHWKSQVLSVQGLVVTASRAGRATAGRTRQSCGPACAIAPARK